MGLTGRARTRYISRVIRQGGSLYALLTQDVCAKLGLKNGDRLAMDAHEGMGLFTKIPLEDLLYSPAARRKAELVRVAVEASKLSISSGGVDNGNNTD